MGTKPGTVLAKQEDSTSTWSVSQNRKIPHQPGAIHKTERFHINLEQFAKQEDSAPKRFRTKPRAVLAKQEDSISTWNNSQNRKIPHQEDSAPNLVQCSQNRKIPHQPEATRKTGRFHINLEHFAKQEDSTSTWNNSQNRKILYQKDSAPNPVQYSQTGNSKL